MVKLLGEDWLFLCHNMPPNHHLCNAHSVTMWTYRREGNLFWYSGLKSSTLPFWFFFPPNVVRNNCFRSHSLFKKYDPRLWKTHSKPKMKCLCYEKQESWLDSTRSLAINAESNFAHPLLFSSPPQHTSLEYSSPKSGEKLELMKSIYNDLGMFY